MSKQKSEPEERNQKLLDACPKHEWQQVQKSPEVFRCSKCGGEVDALGQNVHSPNSLTKP